MTTDASFSQVQRNLSRYVGLTHFRFLSWRIWRWATYPLWKRFFCPHHIHLFDETAGVGGHALDCDACGLVVHIGLIETSEQACARAEKGLYIETTVTEKED